MARRRENGQSRWLARVASLVGGGSWTERVCVEVVPGASEVVGRGMT